MGDARIHNAPFENLITFMELMYGIPLTLPAELPLHTESDLNVKRYLAQLRDSVGQLRSTHMSKHGTPMSSVANDLHKAKFVFVHRDAL